jgi:hypothetical protein
MDESRHSPDIHLYSGKHANSSNLRVWSATMSSTHPLQRLQAPGFNAAAQSVRAARADPFEARLAENSAFKKPTLATDSVHIKISSLPELAPAKKPFERKNSHAIVAMDEGRQKITVEALQGQHVTVHVTIAGVRKSETLSDGSRLELDLATGQLGVHKEDLHPGA